MREQSSPLRLRNNRRIGRPDDMMMWTLRAINGEPHSMPSTASRRLGQILAGLKEVDKICRELAQHLEHARRKDYGDDRMRQWPRHRGFADSYLDDLNRRGEKRLRDVNSLLARYRRAPFLQVNLDYHGIRDVPNWKSILTSELEEQVAVEKMLDAVRDDSLRRYRQCDECGRWFYAATDHQRFCKDACRKRYASESDEYRTKRRIYMRKYRRDEKQRNEDAKASVNVSRPNASKVIEASKVIKED